MSLKYEVIRVPDNNIIYSYMSYLMHGVQHRIDGPSDIWGDGWVKFYTYGNLKKQQSL